MKSFIVFSWVNDLNEPIHHFTFGFCLAIRCGPSFSDVYANGPKKKTDYHTDLCFSRFFFNSHSQCDGNLKSSGDISPL